MASQLYLKDTYLNRNIEILSNTIIVEFDLKSANTSLCREYKLLSDSEIDKIEDMPKDKRVVTIGKKMRSDTAFKDGLKSAFIDIRKRFIEANDLDDGDILAIRKDAIFCLKEVSVTKFGHCKFVEKNHYTSFLRLGMLEIFYSPRYGKDGLPILDIKGIDDETLKYHQNGMLKFLRTLLKHLETSSKSVMFSYVRRFIDRYKNRRLDLCYYREFNQMSLFRVTDSSTTYMDETFLPEHPFDTLDIDYNFSEILLPIVKILL